MIIDKKTLGHLAELSRTEVDPEKESKLLKDLENILAYFEELKTLDTKRVEPMAGGAALTNVFRGDEETLRLVNEKALGAFPEKERGFLKTPPVFEGEDF